MAATEVTDPYELRMFVCLNDRSKNENPSPSCGPCVSEADFKAVKEWIKEKGLKTKVKCTKVYCFDHCNPEGGVVAIYPKGTYVKGLRGAEDLKRVLREEYPALREP